MTVEASVTCDGCAHIILAASNSITARRELRAMGGKVTRDGDFCAACVESGRKARVLAAGRDDADAEFMDRVRDR